MAVLVWLLIQVLRADYRDAPRRKGGRRKAVARKGGGRRSNRGQTRKRQSAQRGSHHRTKPKREKRDDNAPAVPPNAIVVDGSNVMHWGGDPDVNVLRRVIRGLEKQGKTPIVFFDANAGYMLDDRYYDEAQLAEIMSIKKAHVCVAHSGVVADEWILDFATTHRLRIVSNDRYRDWKPQFEMVGDHKRFLRGRWQQGSVMWDSKRR
ncbi:hypothetical protein V8J84_03655 [Yoonia sp. 208BN28-4]